MAWLEPVTLEGEHAALEPLVAGHEAELAAACADGRLWELWYTSAPQPDAVAADIATKLDWAQRHLLLPFACRRIADDRVVGVTTFLNPLPAIPAVEIGYTWNSASARRRSARRKRFAATRRLAILVGC